MTSFYDHQGLSHSTTGEHQPHKDNPHAHFDFISTLALAQERNLDFLSIKWRPDVNDGPSNILRGGTARINQLPMTTDMRMAFKIVKVVDEFNVIDWSKTNRALFNEIAILTFPHLRGHPNIVQLEGLAWDIEDERITPVLVLEKSSCGDAARFFISEESASLEFDEKLQLCFDIGNALMHLHSCHTVHGDIKPENILIDREVAGKYTAKLADFGYSSFFLAGQLHGLPKSRPWNAPEISSFAMNFEDAVSADVYSYAMVCLWILFQGKSVLNPPRGGEAFLLLGNAHANTFAIEELKHADELKRIACKIVVEDNTLKSLQRQRLINFFEQTLVKVDSAGIRQTNFIILLGFLANDSSIIDEPENCVDEDEAIPVSDFQIAPALLQLSRLDYKVRAFVVSELQRSAEEHACLDCRENAAYQIALCLRLGFGIRRNVLTSSHWLKNSNRDGTYDDVMQRMSFSLDTAPPFPIDGKMPYIDVEIMFLKFYETDHPYHNPKMNSFYNDSIFFSIDYAQEYRLAGHSSLEQACQTYRREVDDIREELGDDHEIVFNLRNILSWLLKEAGQLKAAKKIAEEHYDSLLVRPEFGPEDPETLTQLSFLAEICQQEGDFESAKAHLEKILEIQQKNLSSDHLGILLTLTNLAETLCDSGELDKSEEYASKALSGRLEVLGEQNADTLISMNNMGTTWIAQGRFEEAEELLSRAETIATKILGATDLFTLTIVNNLGAALFFQNKSTQACTKLETSLQNCQISMGPMHPATYTSMLNLGTFHLSNGDFKVAGEMCQTSAEKLEELLGAEHPSTLSAKEALVRIADGVNDYQRAEELSRDLLDISKRTLGEGHVATLNRADTLASMLMNGGKDTEAGDLYQWVLNTKETNLGLDDPDTLITVHNLANIRNIERKFTEAQELYTRAYEGLLLKRGPHHSSTLMSLGKLASVYGALREFELAERLAREAIEGFQDVDRRNHREDDGSQPLIQDHHDEAECESSSNTEDVDQNMTVEDSPHTLNSMCILGVILERRHREPEAEVIYRHVLKGYENLFGPDSHDALMIVGNLARVLYEQTRYEEALELVEKSASGLEDLLGPDHPDVIVGKYNLAQIRERVEGGNGAVRFEGVRN